MLFVSARKLMLCVKGDEQSESPVFVYVCGEVGRLYQMSLCHRASALSVQCCEEYERDKADIDLPSETFVPERRYEPKCACRFNLCVMAIYFFFCFKTLDHLSEFQFKKRTG